MFIIFALRTLFINNLLTIQMPYRRLPNTDNARLKALTKAFEKGKETPPFKLAFGQATLRRIQSFYPNFEKALLEYKKMYQNQVTKNKDYLQKMRKAKIYISHFIQVLNMAIARGEIGSAERELFGLEKYNNKVPALHTEESIIGWGKKLIAGEDQRKLKGATLIINPSIALVKVRYDHFLESYNFQKTLQKDRERAHNNIAALREQADDIILNIWNEVEKTYEELPEDIKREKSTEYGITYVYRKNELRRISLSDITS